MSSKGWLEGNNRYLGASLNWLRLRLQRLASQEVVSLPAEKSEEESTADNSPGFFGRLFGASEESVAEVPLLPEKEPQSPDEELTQALSSREAAASIEPPPALVEMVKRMDLSAFERDTLLLCAAMELDPSFAVLCARAQGNETRNYPTFALALSLFEDPSWDALAAVRPLRYAHLIEVTQSGALPLTSSPLRADERVVSFLKGLNLLDERLATLVSRLDPGGEPMLSLSQQRVVEEALRQLKVAAGETVLPVVQLIGDDGGSKRAVAQGICAALERRLYHIGVDGLPAEVEETELLARLWQRESLLLPVALYIEAEILDESGSDAIKRLQRLLVREMGLVFIGARESPLHLGCPNLSLDVARPTASEQRDAWKAVLGGSESVSELEGTAEALAGQFNLNLLEIQEAGRQAVQTQADQGLRQGLWDACRDYARPRLDLLAQHLEPKATWEDIVLPAEPMGLLRQITGQVRERHKVYDQWGFADRMNRGFGITALFSGESGTGKTMAAEVIANDLRLNLYRIDLSAVVSKYIGETEKNLRKLFDAAEQGGSILFFDEADALFGKRSEVRDSHDRYANIEINYLLQRMEAFSGLAILATNMKSALDPAFMRRLRFIVEFRFPGIRERQSIWEKALPPRTPRNSLDYERLARINITGGNIHSIVLHAAFMAAQNAESVTMPLLLAAARTELRKLDKPVNEALLR